MAADCPCLRRREDRPARIARPAVIALFIAAGFVVRVFVEGDPGPPVPAPTLLAALWWGRRGGVAVGLMSTLAYMIARALNPDMADGSLAAALGYRLVAYCAAGYASGWLVEDRLRLRDAVEAGERQMAELRDLQEALAPPGVPSRPALKLASCYVPAEGGAGGDFFLVAPGPGDTTVVVIGDVAARACTRPSARPTCAWASRRPALQDNPCKLLDLANSNLIERAGVSDCFVTAACFVVHPSENKLTWALAGHPPALLLADGQSLNKVQAAFPLGIGEDIDCEMGETTMEPGTGFVAFTDGLIERAGAAAPTCSAWSGRASSWPPCATASRPRWWARCAPPPSATPAAS